MNINDLKNFKQVSESGSISHAAKYLGVSQPTLSESIKRLERDLGVILLYRSKKGIRLTPTGQEKLRTVKDVLLRLELLPKKNKSLQNYRIGCHPIVAEYFLAAFLKEMNARFPNARFILHHDRSQDVQTSIQDGSIDLGIVVNPRRNPDLIIKKLCLDQMIVWKPYGSFNENQLICDPDLLQTQNLIRNNKKLPNSLVSTNDFSLIGELIQKKVGIGILPRRFVEKRKLKLKPITDIKPFKDEISLVYRPEFGKSDNEIEMISLITLLFN